MNILNRKEFSGLLKEWKSFLNEDKFTDVKYKKGQKVKIKICCGGCAKAASTENFETKKGETFKGTVTAPNLNNRSVKFDGKKTETEVNFVMVKIGKKKEESFPQCCIDLGMKENE